MEIHQCFHSGFWAWQWWPTSAQGTKARTLLTFFCLFNEKTNHIPQPRTCNCSHVRPVCTAVCWTEQALMIFFTFIFMQVCTLALQNSAQIHLLLLSGFAGFFLSYGFHCGSWVFCTWCDFEMPHDFMVTMSLISIDMVNAHNISVSKWQSHVT